jgi:ParB/RepB/Spo0J family partition protein
MTTAVAPGAQITALRLDTLAPHPANRKHFDELKLAELTKSVAIDGVLVPLLVRPVGGNHHQIIAGERRWRAAKGAKLSTVPCIVRDMTDEQALERLITDNLQREDPHPLEEAETFDAWLQMDGHDVAGLAAKVGKSPTYIYSRLQLRRLGKEAQKAFWDEKLPIGHAQVIARLEEADQPHALSLVHLGADGQAVRSLADFMSCLVEYDLRLADAPFPLGDGSLCPTAGSCTACPKRTGFKDGMFPELAAAMKEAEDQEGIEDTCLDEACFREKEQAFVARQLAETASAHGQAVHLTTRGSERWPSSAKAPVPFGVWKPAKEGSKGAVPGVIVAMPHVPYNLKPQPTLGQVLWVTLKAKQAPKVDAKQKASTDAKAAAKQVDLIKAERDRRYFGDAKALIAHAPDKLNVELVRMWMDRSGTWQAERTLRELGMKVPAANKATPTQLGLLMLAEVIGNDVDSCESEPLEVLAVAKILGFDAKKFLAKYDATPRAGTCQFCRCTEETACSKDGQPCGWANKERTLCTACDALGKGWPPKKPAKKGGKK